MDLIKAGNTSADESKTQQFPRLRRSLKMRIRVALLLLAAASVAFSPEVLSKDKKANHQKKADQHKKADQPKKAHKQKDGDKKGGGGDKPGKGKKDEKHKKAKNKGDAKKGGGKQGGKPSTQSNVRADVMAWIQANNPGLNANFLRTEPPDRTIKLPDGRTVPIFKLKQFLDVNFRLTFYARKNEKGAKIVPVMEERLRKLMARPEFRERVMTHRREYKIAGKGKVSSGEAYRHFRNIDRHLGVTASKKVKAPVGGGGGINAPSWAVWKQMNLFFHEACHCIGIGHDSGGLSGPIAGTLRQWDRKRMWNYDMIDLNALGG